MKLKEKLAIQYIRTKLILLSLVSKRKSAEKTFELFCTPFHRHTSKPTSLFVAAEKLDFIFEGLKIKGYRWKKDKPNKVLILHGFGSAAPKFQTYITALIAKGYQVCAFDAPGHGYSEGSTINALQYSKMIEEINLLYGPFNGFIAHSLGALSLSLALENLVHTANTKVVFIAAATETKTAADDAFKILGLRNKRIRQEFDNIIRERSGHDIEWFSINRAIKNSKANILWIHDEDDKITPLTDVLPIKAQNPKNITFYITKGLGHRKIYRDTTVKNMVEQFM